MGYVTRIAPSPTGLFHLGTARTAYFNWLAARASGGRFILRIDDTDAARNDEAYVNVILDAMAWLGLDYDAVCRQSERAATYANIAKMMLDKGSAYEDVTDAGTAIRLRLPDDLPATWDDRITRGIRVTDEDRKLIDGLVLVRSDGTPTYHFASIVDDLSMGVNLVIRGDDHLNNTIKQIAIAKGVHAAFRDLDEGIAALSGKPVEPMPIPEFCHVGLIFMIDPETGKRRKMSKRDKGVSLLEYRDSGYSPDAVLNFLLMLGWAATDANFAKKFKMVTKEDAVNLFLTAGNMKNRPALFDPVLLDTLDRRFKAAAGVRA